MSDLFRGRIRLLLVALMTGATAVACSDDSTTEPPGNNNPPENVIQLTASNTFDPALDTVAVNTTVEWRNTGGVGHTLTSLDNEWEEEIVPQDDSWTYTHMFDEAGVYDYECTIHPGMEGRIVVEE